MDVCVHACVCMRACWRGSQFRPKKNKPCIFCPADPNEVSSAFKRQAQIKKWTKNFFRDKMSSSFDQISVYFFSFFFSCPRESCAHLLVRCTCEESKMAPNGKERWRHGVKNERTSGGGGSHMQVLRKRKHTSSLDAVSGPANLSPILPQWKRPLILQVSPPCLGDRGEVRRGGMAFDRGRWGWGERKHKGTRK